MILNEEIARSFERREAGVFVPNPGLDASVNAVRAVFSTLNIQGGEGKEITLATIRNILSDADLKLSSDEMCELVAELVGRGLIDPVLQVIDGGDHHFLEQGEDYTSLPAILTGNESCAGPVSGDILHKSQIFVSYKVVPSANLATPTIRTAGSLFSRGRVKTAGTIIFLSGLMFLFAVLMYLFSHHVSISLH